MNSYPSYNAASKSHPTIEVLGEGTVTASPNRAIVVLGCHHQKGMLYSWSKPKMRGSLRTSSFPFKI